MVSNEFQAFNAALQARMATGGSASLQEIRAAMDSAMSKLPLADSVEAARVGTGGVPSILCRRLGGENDPWILYFHGGGYRLGSALAYQAYGSHLAKACRAQVLLVDYRLAPEHPFPSAVEDAAAAYRSVLENVDSTGRLVVGGDSAGAGLVGALLLYVKSEGLALPAGAFLLSPWADLVNRAGSYVSRADTDKLFSKRSADEAARLYLGDLDPTDFRASPLYGDWRGMPPTLIQVSDAEVLIDDATGLADVIRRAGGDVELQIVPDMPHVWQLHYPAFPEAVLAVKEIAEFVSSVTARTRPSDSERDAPASASDS